jgi:hypothetical protein
VNLVRATFLDPEVRRLVGDWDSVAYSAVSRLRALAGPDIDDPRASQARRQPVVVPAARTR